jgi:hypothetical protein
MRVVKKNVYYCDFCKKKNLSGHAMKVHEKHCTANPDRECRMCGFGDVKDRVEEIKNSFTIVDKKITNVADGWMYMHDDTYTIPAIEWKDEVFTMQKIREVAEDCPVCILAILRQTELYKLSNDYEFDFKKESAAAFQEKVNENRPEY